MQPGQQQNMGGQPNMGYKPNVSVKAQPHAKTNQPCQNFQSGACNRVHCKYTHFFSGLELSKKAEFSVTQPNETITHSTMVNNGNQVLMVSQQRAMLYELPSLKELGSFPMQGQVTCVRAFDSTPNCFFFGMQTPQGGSINVMMEASSIAADQAHAGVITCFEQAAIGGDQVLFSGATDSKIKAWKMQNGAL